VTVVSCCASVWCTAYWGGLCCDCGVLLCVGMGYCILGGLCFMSVVCCSASA